MFRAASKVKAVKRVLIHWHWTKPPLQLQVTEAREELAIIQETIFEF